MAAALTERALELGEFVVAEKVLRLGLGSNSDSCGLWRLLGGVILQSEISRSKIRFGSGALLCDQKRLAEAERAFGKAITISKQKNNDAETLEAYLNRRRVRILLERKTEAGKDLSDAVELYPQDPMVIEALGESLGLEGRFDEAIECMRRLAPECLSTLGICNLGTFLLERGKAADYENAATLVSNLVTSRDKLPEGLREECIEICFDAYGKNEQFEDARELLDQIPAGVISKLSRETLTGKLNLLEGEKEASSECANRALSQLQDTPPRLETRRLAQLLLSLGRFLDALPLWERIADRNIMSHDTRGLLECASRLQRHEIMLDVFRNLRAEGQSDPELLDIEIDLYKMYNIDIAIQVLDEEISKRPNDLKLRLQRSWLGLALDREDLVDKDAKNVPIAKTVDPEIAIQAVHVLKAIGEGQAAVDYAYQVVRDNFSDPNAHRTLMIALGPFGREPTLNIPECVQIGAAVCYGEQGHSESHWIIVEESIASSSQLPEREITPGDELCDKMLGKRVGDTFLLASGIQDRVGEIKQIQNKYIYRYQHSLTQWQILFPGLPDIQAISVSRREGDGSSEGEFDFGVIFDSVDQRQKNLKEIEEIYQNNPLPLHVFGGLFEKTAFNSIQHLSFSEEVGVKCCDGSAQELDLAVSSLRSCNTLVLDMTAISTLFLLEGIHWIENFGVELQVSSNTVNEIRQMIANEGLNVDKASGVIFKTDTGHGLVEQTSAQKMKYIQRLRTLVTTIEQHCDVVACENLAALEPNQREKLLEAFGRYGAETLMLASSPGKVLWTDDKAQGDLGRTQFGITPVWTQIVMRDRVNSGVIDLESFFQASAKLSGYRYSFTSQNPEILYHSGIMAGWKIGEWPFAQALETFIHPAIEQIQKIQLCAGFLKLLYKETVLPITRANITVDILTKLKDNPDGIESVRILYNSLPMILELNPLGLTEANQTFDLWFRTTREVRL